MSYVCGARDIENIGVIYQGGGFPYVTVFLKWHIEQERLTTPANLGGFFRRFKGVFLLWHATLGILTRRRKVNSFTGRHIVIISPD